MNTKKSLIVDRVSLFIFPCESLLFRASELFSVRIHFSFINVARFIARVSSYPDLLRIRNQIGHFSPVAPSEWRQLRCSMTLKPITEQVYFLQCHENQHKTSVRSFLQITLSDNVGTSSQWYSIARGGTEDKCFGNCFFSA